MSNPRMFFVSTGGLYVLRNGIAPKRISWSIRQDLKTWGPPKRGRAETFVLLCMFYAGYWLRSLGVMQDKYSRIDQQLAIGGHYVPYWLIKLLPPIHSLRRINQRYKSGRSTIFLDQ